MLPEDSSFFKPSICTVGNLKYRRWACKDGGVEHGPASSISFE
jgi:hypothetical protein